MSTRTVEGGFINAATYPDDGEPDWREKAQRLQLALVEIENSIAGVRGAPAQRVRKLIRRALGKLG